jgi:hypothetical protein
VNIRSQVLTKGSPSSIPIIHGNHLVLSRQRCFTAAPLLQTAAQLLLAKSEHKQGHSGELVFVTVLHGILLGSNAKVQATAHRSRFPM